MDTILDSAHTWFFESSVYRQDRTLEVRLAEGIKGETAAMVEESGARLGPFFPVTIQSRSRVVLVQFPQVVAHQIIDESYPTRDPDITKGSGRFLLTVENTSFSKFIATSTLVPDLCTEPLLEYMLWSEDQVLSVLSHGVPTVKLLFEAPDLTMERATTWSAS
jgi:hypothetical protein